MRDDCADSEDKGKVNNGENKRHGVMGRGRRGI